MNYKVLPIGSIIRVAKTDVMICAYVKKGNKINGEEYDYACCIYPTGMDKNAVLVKNQDIERVVFIGFQDARFKKLEKAMEEEK